MTRHGDERSVAAAAWRGAVAAMAMTGMRSMTRDLALVERPPPEEIAEDGMPGVFHRIPPERRHETIELAHWGYGAAAGAVFGSLPRGLRARSWSGPAYGVAIWLGFELGIAPLLGIRHPARRPLSGRLAVLADHLLYGTIVADRPRRP